MRFVKYHGLGNDFVLVLDSGPTWSRDEIRRVAARGTGIGADGIVWARPSELAHVRMELVNSDGSVPEMCGNGLRCLVKHVVDHEGRDENPLVVETLAGDLACTWRRGADGRVASVRVAMGRPEFPRGDRLDVTSGGRTFRGTFVSTGNPHFVVFLEREEPAHLAREYGPGLERHPEFPARANVEFARILAPDHVEIAVFERGAGLTRACGTGATATVAAGVRSGLLPAAKPVTATLPGGDLEITVAEDLSQCWMEGPAVEVYRGELLT